MGRLFSISADGVVRQRGSGTGKRLSLQSAFVVVIVTAAGVFFQRMQACIMHPELSET